MLKDVNCIDEIWPYEIGSDIFRPRADNVKCAVKIEYLGTCKVLAGMDKLDNFAGFSGRLQKEKTLGRDYRKKNEDKALSLARPIKERANEVSRRPSRSDAESLSRLTVNSKERLTIATSPRSLSFRSESPGQYSGSELVQRSAASLGRVHTNNVIRTEADLFKDDIEPIRQGREVPVRRSSTIPFALGRRTSSARKASNNVTDSAYFDPRTERELRDGTGIKERHFKDEKNEMVIY